MSETASVKQTVRRMFLWGLRGASRPTLLYKNRQPVLTTTPTKVLVIRPDHLGDVLWTTPALNWLRRQLPDAEITVLLGSWGVASLEGNPDVDQILRCQFPGFSRQPKSNLFDPYLYALEQSRLLRRQNYDVVINLRYDFWWGALLAYLADIPIRIGYDLPESRPFLTHPLSFQQTRLQDSPFSAFGQPAEHSAALNLALMRHTVEQLGLEVPPFKPADTRLKFIVPPEDRRFVQLHLSEWGINRHDKLIALHPGSGATVKLWTTEGFATLNDALVERYGAKVVLCGGEGEAVLLKEIVKQAKHKPLRWDTGNNWARLGALFEQCRLVVGLDSGPLNLAVAVSTPSVHLFGPTDTALFGPWGDPKRHRVVRTEIDLPCCPCGVLDFKRACWRGGYCMRTIKVSQVLNEIEAFTGWKAI
jgi:ADP-heptose:LPS heptosyltransferase